MVRLVIQNRLIEVDCHKVQLSKSNDFRLLPALYPHRLWSAVASFMVSLSQTPFYSPQPGFYSPFIVSIIRNARGTI